MYIRDIRTGFARCCLTFQTCGTYKGAVTWPTRLFFDQDSLYSECCISRYSILAVLVHRYISRNMRDIWRNNE